MLFSNCSTDITSRVSTECDTFTNQRFKMHPLEIDVVVSNILKYVSLGEIAKFRGVSKAWFKIGTGLLVSRIDEKEMLFIANEEVGTGFIDWYLHIYENCSFDFTNFKFIRFPMGAVITKQLFKRCGLAVQTLTLQNVSITSLQLADLLVNQVPFVKVLTLSGLPKEVKENRIFSNNMKPSLELRQLTLDDGLNYSLPFLKDLFSSSPKFETLKMKTNFDSQWQENKVLETLVNEGFVENIRKLKLSRIDDRVFRLLETHFKSSPLKEFIVGYHGHGYASHIKEPYFETFINDHKDRWERLDIMIANWQVNVQFPEMRNLKFLSFGSRFPLYNYEIRPSFGIFDYGKMFPNLVTLHLSEAESQRAQRMFNLKDLFPENSTSVLTLKNLELPEQLDRETLRRIGKIFPNVLKLHLSYQPMEVYTELWTLWPRNLAICIFDSDRYGNEKKKVIQSYDSIFTGISDKCLEELQSSSIAFEQSMIIGPSICNLKELRHLIIHDGPNLNVWQNWTPPSEITDTTFRYALMYMKNLVCLHIESGIHKVSKLCLEDTCSKLELIDSECSIATQLVKYKWQREKLGSTTLFLFRELPDYV